VKWLGLLWVATIFIYVYVGMKHGEKISDNMKWEAANGDPKAMYELGRRFSAKGKGEFDGGQDLIRRSAEKGYAPAQYDMGYYHLLISNDLKEAYKWMTLASEQSYKDALLVKNSLVKDLTPSEIKAVEKELEKLRPQQPQPVSEKKS
jgi:TPR repeat protein